MDTYLTARPFPVSESSPESDWLPAARRGERWALEELYRRHSAQIYGLCYRILGRTEDAEDAMQAAFVQAFRELPRFRGDSLARTWIYRIATNEAVNTLRKRGRCDGDFGLDNASVPDEAPAVQRRIAVLSSLNRLRSDQRIILILRYWEELSYDEICAVLNISMPSVKMRLSRARTQFRKVYGEER